MVFMAGCRQAELYVLVALIGDKAVGIKGDVSNLTDLDHVLSLFAV